MFWIPKQPVTRTSLLSTLLFYLFLSFHPFFLLLLKNDPSWIFFTFCLALKTRQRALNRGTMFYITENLRTGIATYAALETLGFTLSRFHGSLFIKGVSLVRPVSIQFILRSCLVRFILLLLLFLLAVEDDSKSITI